MSSAGGFAPGKLWSLWEIMQQFDGGNLFIKITGLSNMGHGIGNGGMLVMPTANHDDIKANVDFVCGELERLELVTSLASAKELKKIIHTEVIIRTPAEMPSMPPEAAGFAGNWAFFDTLVVGRYQNYAGELVNRFKDELSARTVVTVSPRHAKYLKGGTLFGDDVFNAFPSAADDIAESGACLTFERGTACVMHLMRAAEVGLSALAKSINVGKQNDWGSYLREIDKELVKRAKTSGTRSQDEQFYSEAATSFDHLKRAWRNPTMHVDRSYSPDRAEEIFQAVGSFMRHLATKVSE
jgi:hypothetical protein